MASKYEWAVVDTYDSGGPGYTATLFKDGEPVQSRRFVTRDKAQQWATERYERAAAIDLLREFVDYTGGIPWERGTAYISAEYAARDHELHAKVRRLLKETDGD
jgi:hypothetical protein